MTKVMNRGMKMIIDKTLGGGQGAVGVKSLIRIMNNRFKHVIRS